MSDCYDDMSTADLLREVCRKLDRIEKQGAPRDVAVHIGDVKPFPGTDGKGRFKPVRDFDGTVSV